MANQICPRGVDVSYAFSLVRPRQDTATTTVTDLAKFDVGERGRIGHSAHTVCDCVADNQPQDTQGRQDQPYVGDDEVFLLPVDADGDAETDEYVRQRHHGPFHSLQKPRVNE